MNGEKTTRNSKRREDERKKPFLQGFSPFYAPFFSVSIKDNFMTICLCSVTTSELWIKKNLEGTQAWRIGFACRLNFPPVPSQFLSQKNIWTKVRLKKFSWLRRTETFIQKFYAPTPHNYVLENSRGEGITTLIFSVFSMHTFFVLFF